MTDLDSMAARGDLTTSGVRVYLRVCALRGMVGGAFAMLVFALVQLGVRDDRYASAAGREFMTWFFSIPFLVGAAMLLGGTLLYAASTGLARRITS